MGNVNLEEDSSKLVSYIDPYWFVAVNEIVFVPPWLYTKGDIEPSNCFVLCTSNSYRTIVNIPIYRYVPPIRRFIHADNCTRNAVIGDWKRCI